jgi:hypothetical protein
VGRNTYMQVAGCFAMMCLYLHLKGFVHDTWYDYSLVSFTGCMVGLYSNPMCRVREASFIESKREEVIKNTPFARKDETIVRL